MAKELGYQVEEFNTLTITKDLRMKKDEPAPNFIRDGVLLARKRNTYENEPLLILIDQADVIETTSQYSQLADQLVEERDSKEYKRKTGKNGKEVVHFSVKKRELLQSS